MGSGRGDETPFQELAPQETVPTHDYGRTAAQKRRARPDRLVQVEGPGAPREVVLGEHPLVLGRADGVGLQLESGHVSRRHAVIRRDGDDLECRDLDSRNGTWLNDLRIHSAVLREGDTLLVGDALFVFRPGR